MENEDVALFNLEVAQQTGSNLNPNPKSPPSLQTLSLGSIINPIVQTLQQGPLILLVVPIHTASLATKTGHIPDYCSNIASALSTALQEHLLQSVNTSFKAPA